MSDKRRLEYLEAMGVVSWSRRTHRVTERVVQRIPENPVLAGDVLTGTDAKSPISKQADSNSEISQQPDSSADLSTVPDLPIPPERPQTVTVTLESLQREASACKSCSLGSTRIQSVFGCGDTTADWMFVGEGPGAEEDRQGLPFVGPAGQLLNAMLKAIGLDRDDVYIANLVKCRPPQNRDPRPEELAACQHFLHGQLQIIQPKIIIALGRFSAQSLTGSTDSIGRLRGRVYQYGVESIPLVATYHPAYLLRSPSQKGKVWRDLLLAERTIHTGQPQ